MDADDAVRVGLIERHYRASGIFRLPLSAVDVRGDLVDVARAMQVLQRLWVFLLVHGVLVDQPVQGSEILAEILLLRPRKAVAVDGHGDSQQDQQDADHHHHLDQRESTAPRCWSAIHLPIYHCE